MQGYVVHIVHKTGHKLDDERMLQRKTLLSRKGKAILRDRAGMIDAA